MKNYLSAAAYLEELKVETVSTRQCLERIPESTYEFKPHPKSMAMGYLALLVADIPRWISISIEEGDIDFATYKQFDLSTCQALLDQFDKNIAGAEKALSNVNEERLTEPFSLKNKAEVLYTNTIIENISQCINHLVHHRGQLTVYMRLNDILVPSIYGPSADDKSY